MCDSFEKLKELNLTRDEVQRIGDAFKKDEFRQLFNDYIKEIQDPENRKQYEREIIELEKQRGIDATFIKPTPGYVLKTSLNGQQKCFINICASEQIAKPTSVPDIKDGQRGLQWSLPHTITPPRDDYDNNKISCRVVDVVFHPNTLYLAKKNKDFQQMVNTTAMDTIEKHFDIELDRRNVKLPKLSYKGVPQAAIVRKSSGQQLETADREFYDKLFKNIDDSTAKPVKKSSKTLNSESKYTIPKYLIKYRNYVEFDEFVDDKHAKLHTTIPKELQIEIDLPLLQSSNDITLDVNEKTVELISEKPAKYRLSLTLPYKINQDCGNAKFDKDQKKLIVLLPVKRPIIDINHDSGIESDCNQLTEITDNSNNNKNNNQIIDSFLDNDLDYLLPEFNCHYFESTLAFTINVKNVDQNSLKKLQKTDSIHIKFYSIGSSYYPINYAIYIKLPATILDDVVVEIWDNNVILQLPLNQQLQYYYYGIDADHLQEKYLEEPSIINHILENTIIEEVEETDEIPENSFNSGSSDCRKSEAISIFGTSYESSCDELSCSYSPSKSKGILKNRRFVGRSISESSLDDYVCCSSVDNEMSTSFKKTVRFNEVIMRQLYRSNSSILGQKKKNQRKARNKKRAQEQRRHSESEASEIDDKLTSIEKTEEIDEISLISNDIFQMEIGS